ncbi:hypothetical protein [Kocuria palustris]|uniref:hypothetical protein n=1 Tax=Kocuria palustris TaxID=71999 RepID=UPI00119CCB68|nr:hypothetical protein [Kocuria palustris]
MDLSSRSRAALIAAAALVVVLGAVLVWRLGPGRPVSDGEIAMAHAYRSTEQLRDSDRLEELPAPKRDELRGELESQLEAIGRPSERALEAAEEQPPPVGMSQADHVPGLPGGFLTSARSLRMTPPETAEDRAVLSSIAAHRAATALELGADPAKVDRAAPVPSADDALAAAPQGEDAPHATGEQAHPELALARQLGQARSSAQTWSALPEDQRPSSDAWARALEPVQDSQWLSALEQRHPSVIDGSPGMPEGFRSAPDAARDDLVAGLRQTALAQIAASAPEDREAPASAGPEPGQSVLIRLSVADAAAQRPVDALPGLED